MDGFVTDYVSTYTAEIGTQPTYEQYAQIMTGYTPEQVPVLNGIARGFGVFDHWFSEVPSQTFMNRSFWTAATSSGFVVNSPVSNFVQHNTAETLFERLEAHGRTWKVYIQEPMAISFTGLIHMPRLKERLATHLVPYAEFERDAAEGTLPDFSLLEPNLTVGHSDYHPACGRSFIPGDMDLAVDPPSSINGGEAYLARIYGAIRSAAAAEGSNAYNTLFFIGWDEPGGTYDHVPPGPVPPPDPSAPAGQMGFEFDRSGYRVPAIIVSPWIDEGNGDQRGTPPHLDDRDAAQGAGASAIAFTARDAAAAPFDHLLSREDPRDPAGWPDVEALPVPELHLDMVQMGQGAERARQDHGRRTPGARQRGRLRGSAGAGRPEPAAVGGTDPRRRAGHRSPVLPAPGLRR